MSPESMKLICQQEETGLKGTICLKWGFHGHAFFTLQTQSSIHVSRTWKNLVYYICIMPGRSPFDLQDQANVL